MGNYTGAPSTAENVISSVKEVLGMNRTKPKPGNLADNPPAPESPGGNYTKRDADIDKAVHDAETGDDSSHSSDQASNAGKQAQSTDHWNQY